jgi:putative aldouronate transport system permease protein
MSIKNAALSMTSKKKKRKDLRTRIICHRQIYLFLLFPIIWYLVFHYYPMYGALLAFKNFKYNLGIIRSPWVGLKYFKVFLSDSSFYEVIRNTLTISVLKLIFNFPAPIITAVTYCCYHLLQLPVSITYHSEISLNFLEIQFTVTIRIIDIIDLKKPIAVE